MNPHRLQGPYHRLINDLRSGSPNLEFLGRFMSKRQDYNCRIAVLDFGVPSNDLVTRIISFPPSSRTELHRFLDEYPQSCPHRRLFIVEDLTAEVIEALGYRFSIDPALFASHVSISENSGDGSRDRVNVPRLPSLCDPHEQFHLKYWEIFSIDQVTWDTYRENLARGYNKKHYQIQNADKVKLDFSVFRNLWLEPAEDPVIENGIFKDLNFGLSRCKASFWSYKHDSIDESSWDGKFCAICIRISYAN